MEQSNNSRRVSFISIGDPRERYASHLVSRGSSFQRTLPPAPELPVERRTKLDMQGEGDFALAGPTVLASGIICQGTRAGLVALDAGTMKARWSAPSAGPVDSLFARNDTVFWGTRDGRLVASDPRDGAARWEVKAHDAVSAIVPMASKDSIVFGSRDGHVRCVSATDGELLFERDLGARILAEPCVDGDRIFVGARNGLMFALSAADGRVLGTVETGSDIHGAATAARGMIVFGSDDKRLYAIDRDTLEVRWMFRTGDAIWCKPALFGNLAIVGSTDTYLYGIDLNTGTAAWEIGTTGPIRLGLAMAGETAFVANESGRAMMVEAGTGKVRGVVSLGGSVWSKPTATSAGFVTATRANELISIRPM